MTCRIRCAPESPESHRAVPSVTGTAAVLLVCKEVFPLRICEVRDALRHQHEGSGTENGKTEQVVRRSGSALGRFFLGARTFIGGWLSSLRRSSCAKRPSERGRTISSTAVSTSAGIPDTLPTVTSNLRVLRREG